MSNQYLAQAEEQYHDERVGIKYQTSGQMKKAETLWCEKM